MHDHKLNNFLKPYKSIVHIFTYYNVHKYIYFSKCTEFGKVDDRHHIASVAMQGALSPCTHTTQSTQRVMYVTNIPM